MIKFDINGASVEFDEKMDNYNTVRKIFKLYAKEASENFEKYCIENFKTKKQVSESCLDIGSEYIEGGLKKAIETIVSFKVITIDLEIFKNNYCNKYLNYERLFNNLNKEHLVNNKNKKLNNKFFDIKSEVKKLSKYIYEDCFNIHYAVVDALIQNNVSTINSYIDEESKVKARALFNNYKDGFITNTDECKVVKQIIHLNPYRKDVYEFLIKEDGDFNKEIQRLTNYLGYDVTNHKEMLMDTYIKKIMIEDNNDLEIDQEKITKYAKYIGCEDIAIYLARIDAIYTFENA
ncbi:MAG: kinase [Peptostreptococcaceae bacterium]